MVVVPTSRAAWEVLLARKRSSFLWLVFLGTFAAAQSLSPFRIQKLTAGSAPAGVSVTPIQSALQTLPVYAVVANSGSNSVSIFELYSGGSPLVNVTNTYTVPVPGPYAVATCTNKMDARAVVTSPGDHSISVLSLPTGTLLGKVALGSVAYSADCYWDGTAYKAVVSTTGDNTLNIVDLASFTVTQGIPNVPAAHALHGVEVAKSLTDQTVWIAYVTGTDAGVLTAVRLSDGSLTKVAVPQPVAVRGAVNSSVFFVASGSQGIVYAVDAMTLNLTLAWDRLPGISDFSETSNQLPGAFGPVEEYCSSNGSCSSAGRFVGATTIPGQPVTWFGTGTAPSVYQTPIGSVSGTDSWQWIEIHSLPVEAITLIASPGDNALYLVEGVSPPAPIRVVNGASFNGTNAAPGSLGTIFVATNLTQEYFAPSEPLPVQLGGLALRIGGKLSFDNTNWSYDSTGSMLVPLLYAGPTQINFQVPYEVTLSDPVILQLELPDGSKTWGEAGLSPASPGVFEINNYLAAALNQDNTRNGDPSILPGSVPAKKGSILQLFLTGAGLTMPPVGTGDAVPLPGPLLFTNAQPIVYIARESAAVQFSGMAPGFVGVWQINVQIPPDAASGILPIQVAILNSAPGTFSNTAYIAVQ